jgi:hypothetical protein
MPVVDATVSPVPTGALAMDLSERLDARSSRAKTVICVYDFIVHWKCHVRSILKPLLYGHKLGLQTGEVRVLDASYSAAPGTFSLTLLSR